MKNRTIISKKELADLFKAETKKMEIFSKIYCLVERKNPDKTGCNWMLNISNAEKEVLYKFAESNKELNALLRAKYNLPTE